MSRLEPEEVFKPGGFPLDDESVYVSRDASEASITRAISRSWVPVIYGDYGVGKSTLVRRFFRDAERGGKLVYFESAANLDIVAVITRILESQEFRVEVSRSLTGEVGVGAGISFKVFGFGAEVGGSTKGVIETTSARVVNSPTDGAILELIADRGLVIVIDELHQASDQFKRELAVFIKASRANPKKSALVLIGTGADAQGLVASDPGTDRLVKETRVPLMSRKEADDLVSRGFESLGLSITAGLAASVVSTASGAPSVLQSLCLDMAVGARKSDRNYVDANDLREAIRSYLEDNSSRMMRKYFVAIETQGRKRYRKQVLHAVAAVEQEYATMEDLRRYASSKLGEDVPATALSGPLKALKSAEYGAILQDVERGEGVAVQNVTSFADPMMKSFVRFLANLEDLELMPPDDIGAGSRIS